MIAGTRARLAEAPFDRWISAIVVHALGLHVLAMYGITYYAIGTAAPAIARDMGTTTSMIFGVLGGALIVSALFAPWVGRTVDQIGAGPVLLTGSVLRAAAIFALAVAPGMWTFAAALIAVQILSQPTEYDAAFAAAVQVHGENARTSVSLITLWGGLASTAFWPLSVYLLDHYTWRSMFGLYAVLILALCVPVSLLVMWQARQPIKVSVAAAPEPIAPIADRIRPVRDPATAFVPLALAFSLASVAMGLPVILPPMLENLGLGASAVVAGMLFGPSQTAGRFFELVFGRRLSPLAVASIATGLLPLSLLILVAGGATLTTAIVFAVLFGAGNGVSYVVRGTVVLSCFGPSAYGHWLGRIARIRLLVAALTPFVLALILEQYGAATALIFCAACGLLGMLAFIFTWRRFA